MKFLMKAAAAAACALLLLGSLWMAACKPVPEQQQAQPGDGNPRAAPGNDDGAAQGDGQRKHAPLRVVTDKIAPPVPLPRRPALEDADASVDISSKNMNPPRYPPAAIRAGITGTVILIIEVDADGSVAGITVEKSSGNRDLDRAALDAAYKWRFNPAIVNGQRAAGRVRVPVEYRL